MVTSIFTHHMGYFPREKWPGQGKCKEAGSDGEKMYLERNTFHLTDSNKSEAQECRTTSALRISFSIPIMILTYLSFNITNFLWEID